MNKVISVNLGGIAYQLEEVGYEALGGYIQTAQAALEGNPDREEIVADIEAAIGEKFRVLLGAHKNVVSAREVEAVLREMGPVEGASKGETSSASSAQPGNGRKSPGEAWGAGPDAKAAQGSAEAGKGTGGKPVRRLYRLNEGAMLFGVCSGLEAFTGMDALVFRIGFVFLTLLSGGLVALAYLALVIFVPQADTASERAQAQGPMPTAQDFIKRAREGYYEAVKGFPDRQSRKEWERKFKHDMREYGRQFKWEMRSRATHWQGACQQACAQGPRSFGSRVGLFAFAAVFSLAVLLLCLFGSVSLLTTGSLFGFGLPTGMPIWIGILLLVVFCQLFFWPLKVAFGSACRRSQAGGCGGVFFLLLIVLGFCWWIYPTQTKSMLKEIPPAVEQGADAVKEWWKKP